MWIVMPLVDPYLVNKVSSSSSMHVWCIHVWCIHIETTMHERYRLRWVSNYVTPLLISTCSVLHVRQHSSIYTLVLHTVTTKFVIWLRKWCTVSNEGGTIKVPVYILNR
jgi:hypothetical protein